MIKQLIDIDINKIVTKPHLREDFGDLGTLENSIKKLGLLHPVIIDADNVLIVGARRLQACRNIGLLEISAVRVDVDFRSMTALDIQSDENLCRKKLSPEELEKHIQVKKSTVTGKTPLAKGRGVLDGLKKMFSRG